MSETAPIELGGADKLAHLATAHAAGLTLSDCIAFFDKLSSERDRQIAAMVDSADEDFEVDNALISEGDDNGAYVLGWRWCSFEGTDLDKDDELPPYRAAAEKRGWTVNDPSGGELFLCRDAAAEERRSFDGGKMYADSWEAACNMDDLEVAS